MTWEQLQKDQEGFYLQLKKLEKLNQQKDILTTQLRKMNLEKEAFALEINKIREKLQHIDTFSFLNLLRSWTGEKEELRALKLDQAASLELKQTELEQMIEDLSKDLAIVNEEVLKINKSKLKNQLEIIRVKKQVWLKSNQPEKALELEQLEEDELHCKQLIIEIEEAKAAGKEAVKKLNSALSALSSAKDFSTWDTFLGGGFIATHLKHEKMDESKNQLHRAQIALQRFKNELLDIQEISTSHLIVDADGFVKFADYFFDDIFSAWSVHSKIASSKEHVSRVMTDVRNTLLKLEKKLLQVEQKLHQIKQSQNAILA